MKKQKTSKNLESLPENKELAQTAFDNAVERIRPALERQKKILEESNSIEFKNNEPEICGDSTLGMIALIDELHTTSWDSAILMVLAGAAGQPFGDNEDRNLTFAAAKIRELKPQTSLEGMLIAQMVAVDSAIANCMRNATRQSINVDVLQQLTNSATKFQRTFLQQIEALQKLRGKAQQTVKVEHVHVHPGGQAIVGNVDNSRGEGHNER